jgi:hypothetical protein
MEVQEVYAPPLLTATTGFEDVASPYLSHTILDRHKHGLPRIIKIRAAVMHTRGGLAPVC